MNDLGRRLNVEMKFRRIIDIPDLQLLITAAAGQLLLIRVHRD